MRPANFIGWRYQLFLMVLGLSFTGTLICSDAFAQDMSAVERRLGEAVADGELTLEQASIMLQALKNSNKKEHPTHASKSTLAQLKKWVEHVGHDLKEAVASGKLSEGDALEKWRYFADHEVAPKLKTLVARQQLSEKIATEFWKQLEVSKEEHAKEDFSDKKFIEAKKDWIAGILADKGDFTKDQIRVTLAIIPRIGHEIVKNSESERFRPSEGVRDFLKRKVGLQAEQIELVFDVARRLYSAK